MDNKYTVKFHYDVKGELNDQSYEPTITDFKERFQESLENLTKYYDRLTGSNHEADITAKISIEKVSKGLTGSLILNVDGAKHSFPVTLDTDEPLENSRKLVSEVIKKLTNQINNKLT